MGCGASKAAQVDEENITIKDYPTSSSPHRHAHHEQTNETTAQAKPTDEENDQISPEASDQSAIERAVRDITTSDPLEHQTASNTNQDHEQIRLASTDSSHRLIAFEVCMSDNGSRNPKKAPPRLLAKMESTTKITTEQLTEQLAEKQKLAEERKQKELGKRANSKVSRKERLRKEVMAAREMDMLQQQQSSDRLQAGETDRLKQENNIENKRLDRLDYEPSDCFQGSYDASAEIEVDSTYNTDHDQQLGMWDDDDTQGQSRTKAEQNKDNLEDDDLFFKDQPLTANNV